jgi:hypothetical protein
MPRHMMMWLLAGGGTLVGATMAYVATRPVLAPSAARARAGLRRLRSSLPRFAPRFGMSSAPDGLDHVYATSATRTGSSAFDAYRSAELAKLHEEERAFQDYLSGLRLARDREEFNAFLEHGRERSGTD